jgi:hypothetical protein
LSSNAMDSHSKNFEEPVDKRPCLGVVCLDDGQAHARGHYVDYLASLGYEMTYQVCPGLTFEMARSCKMPRPVRKEFVKVIANLCAQGVSGITSDSSVMMAFQQIARKVATCPVFMSSMVQCPMISAAFDRPNKKVAILTADRMGLVQQWEVLLNECGFDVDHRLFKVLGVEDVPGLGGVAKGERVDVEHATPSIVKFIKDELDRSPTISALCLEATELAPFSDTLRKEFNMPVFDTITCAEFLRQDSPSNLEELTSLCYKKKKPAAVGKMAL